ncbi:MAG: hypothetical protein ACREP5_02100, partial [Candidatus Binatia bacterium]
MAKQQTTKSLDLPLESHASGGVFAPSLSSRFDVATVVMVLVSVVTAYLVLPPLYSVIQTSLFTT